MTVVSVQDMVKRIRLLRDTMDAIYEISNLVKKSSKTNGMLRSNHPEVLCKKDVLRNLTTLLKKRLLHSCFPVNFAKFLRTPFLTEHLWWLLLNVAKHVLED